MTQVTRPTFRHGSKSSVGTSAVQMTTSDVAAFKGVLVKAAQNNSGIVYVGYSDAVTADAADDTTGFPLAAGESLTVDVDNANDIYLIASAAGQKVYFLAI